jgi:hypothetical protein
VDREHDATKLENDSFAPDPQQGCNKMLLQRFRDLRNKLAEIRDNRQVLKSTTKHTNIDKFGKQKWSENIESEFPNLQEVAHMSESTLYTAIQGCTLALGRSAKVSRQKSCWIWTLLALVGDFGTLDNERISRVRDLGLSAGRLVERFCAEQAELTRSAQDDEDTDPDVPDSNTGKQEPCSPSEEHSADQDKPTPKYVSDEKDVVSDPAFPKTDDVALGQDIATEEADDSDAEMVISEDEEGPKETPKDGGLEEARARLLAQLGDRLVNSQVPIPDTPPTQAFQHLSRVEAERQRQEIRRGGLQPDVTPKKPTPVSESTQAKSQTIIPLTEGDWNTKATIDMILTIVAECYGQRDLLKFRAAW